MTIASIKTKVSFAGDGTTDYFPWTSTLFSSDDIGCILKQSDGTEVVKYYNIDFTISFASDFSSATFTTTSFIPQPNETITFYRTQELLQNTDYTDGDEFPAVSHERALDKVVLQNQTQQEQINRSLQVTPSTSTSFAASFIPSAGGVIRVKTDGSGVESAQLVDLTDVTSSTIAARSVIANDSDSTDVPSAVSIDALTVKSDGSTTRRDLSARFSERFNILDYGATAGSGSDESVYIQAAIDACESAGGGIVYFPRGVYLIESSVESSSGVYFLGDGVENTILDIDSGGSLAWAEASLSDINGAGMSDMSVRCDTVTNAITVDNIWGWYCHRCRIWGDGALDTAIFLRGYSFECDIRDCRITDYDTAGIRFDDLSGGEVYPNSTVIVHNDFAGDDTAVAIAVSGGTSPIANVIIAHNHFEHAFGDEGEAVTITNAKGTLVAHNWIGGNYGAVDQITVGAGSVDTRIIGNHLSVTGGTGITVEGAATAHTAIAENIFDIDNGADIIVVDGRNSTVIANNIMRFIDSGSEGVTGSAIDIKNSANDVSISGNIIYGEGAGDMPGTGIKIGNGCLNVSITGGCVNNMTVGLDCDSASASKVITLVGVCFSGNGTTAAIVALTAISIKSCPGLKTEGYGTATITNGNTSVSVNHGLGITPPSSAVTVNAYGGSTNDPGMFFVASTSSTQITFNCQSDPGASGLPLSWQYAMD